MKVESIEWKELTTATGKKFTGYSFKGERDFQVYDFILQKNKVLKDNIESLLQKTFPLFIKVNRNPDNSLSSIEEVDEKNSNATAPAYSKAAKSGKPPFNPKEDGARQGSIERQAAIKCASNLLSAMIQAGAYKVVDSEVLMKDLLDFSTDIYQFHGKM
jgi:hypothetical protein